ncbi:MAG: class I SAM-dependent methyltransferase, partial [Desulforhabdus sp.]|nr:class I SAM-dependent methyltransferase [Desulforhabdus sp.]
LGAGMGWTTCLLAAKTKARVYGIDLRQYEDSQGISFKSELLSRLSRHRQILIEENLLEKSCPLEEIVNRCSFLNMDARELFFKDNFFDFAFSLNSFEHIADPAAAVAELSRTLKPTGEAFLHFQPMYFSDMGHHLFGLLELPWVHLLHDRATIKEMICEQGKVANEVDNILDSLNGYGLEDYMEVLSKTDLQVVDMRIHRGVIIAGADRSEQFIQLKQIYPEEELLATGITVHLRK